MFNIFSTEIDVFGLDLSSPGSLKLAKVTKQKKEKLLVSLGGKKMDKDVIIGGKVRNQEKLTQSIKELIKEVMGEKVTTEYVALSIPERSCFLKTVRMPAMDRKDLFSAILYEAENQFPLPTSDLYMDFRVLSEERKQKEMDVLMVASPKNILDLYVGAVEESGLIPYMIENSPLSLRRALLDEEAKSPTLLLDVNDREVTCGIFFQGCVRFTISFERDPLSDRKDSEESYFKAVAMEAHKCLEYHKKNHQGEQEIRRIIISGEIAEKKKIKEAIFSETGIDVESGKPFFKIDRESVPMSGDALSYATAVGVALKPLLKS